MSDFMLPSKFFQSISVSLTPRLSYDLSDSLTDYRRIALTVPAQVRAMPSLCTCHISSV